MSDNTRKNPIETSQFKELEVSVKEISQKAYYNDTPKQLTIDNIENAMALLSGIYAYPNNSVLDSSSVGSFVYELEVLLELINPILDLDVKYITGLRDAFNKWLEFFNTNYKK